jgi:hypothetical protein
MGTAPGDGPKHRYQHCTDEDCELPYCRVYKEGHRNGREDGYEDGFADGVAACPRDHED